LTQSLPIHKVYKVSIVHPIMENKKIVEALNFRYATKAFDSTKKISKEDFDNTCQNLRERESMSEQAITRMRNENWTYFLSKCRRYIPEPAILQDRLTRLFQIYRAVEHKGEKFIRPITENAFQNLSYHVRKGCLSDVEDFPLYQEMGKGSDGLPIYR